ncbi:hypothetical protein HPB48_005364 [Haemaphysalis longicornis]|uniref:Uncharacterized protein n=1 Tax=Haemaphysalis longicornis TaxID=44386 RepID=A0A9J6GGW2_HAELO|nr:hypothetical protein HPB48_005364 [Haemaphysalis longicornis]
MFRFVVYFQANATHRWTSVWKHRAVAQADLGAASSSAEAVTSAMTLADCGGSNGLCREDTNGVGPPEAKRMRLDDSEQYFVCDCDVEAVIADAIAQIDVRDLFKEEMRRFSTRLSYIDKLERESALPPERVGPDLRRDSEQKNPEAIRDGATVNKSVLDFRTLIAVSAAGILHTR